MITTKTTSPNAAIVYVRTASTHQADNTSLEHQWEICKDYARRYDLRVIGSYVDAGISGLSPRRHALDRMLRELSLGRARYLITADEARLARKPTLRLALELELARYGIKLIYVSQAATMKNAPHIN